MQKDKIDIALDILLSVIVISLICMLAYSFVNAQELEKPIETEKVSSTEMAIMPITYKDITDINLKLEIKEKEAANLDTLASKYARLYDSCRYSK